MSILRQYVTRVSIGLILYYEKSPEKVYYNALSIYLDYLTQINPQ